VGIQADKLQDSYQGLWMAESAIVVKKRVMIVERRAGR